MRRSRGTTARRVALAALLLGAAAPSTHAAAKQVPHGKLELINGYKVLSLDGTPEQMGTACGQLLGPTIRRVIRQLITEGFGRDPRAYANIVAGCKVMEKHQPKAYLTELKALAAAAKVRYRDLLMLQYFGDVRRCITGPGSALMCTSFAVLPPLTRERACLVGRNLDYFDHGVSEYAAVLAYYRPTGKIPFATVTWAGITNGWTALNAKGIVVSNNTAFGAKTNSLKGVATCFLLRQVAEHAATLDQGIDLVKKAKRTCGTNLLIASGNPPDAAVLEFDHAAIRVRRAKGGFVGAANSFLQLYRPEVKEIEYDGRVALAEAFKGKVDIRCNIAGADFVPIHSMNLHSATIDATRGILKVAMGKIPAYKLPYKTFRLTDKGLVAHTVPKRPR